MKTFMVYITRTLRDSVLVKAKNASQAKEIVKNRYVDMPNLKVPDVREYNEEEMFV